jgi:menaquinone-dependent protoporphyrinogen oxidase
MFTNRVLIVYGTKYGQTARIAERMAATLRANGFDVSLQNGDDVPAGVDVGGFAGVIIGASIIRGRYQRCIEKFIRTHRRELNTLPSAFFAVSGAAASPQPDAQLTARQDMAAFLAKVGWQPYRMITVAGSVLYRRYDPLTRMVMKRICRDTGLSADTSQNHEYTDWQQVEQFARQFGFALAGLDTHALVTQ